MANKPFNQGFEPGKGISARRLQLMRDRRLTGIRGGRGILVREIDDGEGGIQALVETRRGPGIGAGGITDEIILRQFGTDFLEINEWHKMDWRSHLVIRNQPWISVDAENDTVKFSQASNYLIETCGTVRMKTETADSEGLYTLQLGYSDDETDPSEVDLQVYTAIQQHTKHYSTDHYIPLYHSYILSVDGDSVEDDYSFFHKMYVASGNLGIASYRLKTQTRILKY